MRPTFPPDSCGIRDSRSLRLIASLGTALTALGMASAAAGQDIPVSLRDSFPLGDADVTLCQVQNCTVDPANVSPFDRSWSIVCRDSARPVGYVHALRGDITQLEQRLQQRRAQIVPEVNCSSASPSERSLNEGAVTRQCSWSDGGLSYLVASQNVGRTTYFVEGLGAYGDALSLALKSIIADRVVPGKIEIATTSVSDPAAFARIQAETLDPSEALAEGYRRNNRGDYAEAAQFFEVLQRRSEEGDEMNLEPIEFLINRALQKSNLGEFAEANRLFAEARALPQPSPVQQRLLRNFEAIHQINQGNYQAAINRLSQPVTQVASSAASLRERMEISEPISMRLNAGASGGPLLGFSDDASLTEEERGFIIDQQGRQLAATARRLLGDNAGARAELSRALDEIVSVREGRVVSVIRLRSQIMAELALVEEDESNFAGAETLLRDSLALLQLQYPETRAVNASRARLASFLQRRGQRAEAKGLYREVVQGSIGQRNALVGFSNQIQPYFDLLIEDLPNDPDLAADFFDATQVLARPGVAETQAILARELSGGTGDAARLFRQSTNLSRAIERARIRYNVLVEANSAETANLRETVQEELEKLERAQTATLAQLAEFPQYRAVSGSGITLDDLKGALQPGEVYVKMSAVGPVVYVFYTDNKTAGAFRASLDTGELDRRVDTIRDSISRFDGRNLVTEPFDVETSRALFVDLLGPITERLTSATHIVFEPDAAMLRLPANLLVTDQASVEAYLDNIEDLSFDVFDFRGIAWLGRNAGVSTAVSARGFVDARAAPASNATRRYLGLGQNEAVFASANIASVRGGVSGGDNCQWPLAQWNAPIDDGELLRARDILGGSQSEVITGRAFSDSGLLARDDLNQYRILHFATHGLVTPPGPQCPARPALVTSFGDGQSDGLLSFQEIFDLRLDADMVILSACDTAGRASVSVTREAGIESGGGTALDGLVRSFVGAGGRSVLASHWPAPDDFGATAKLITGLFEAAPGTPVQQAMRDAQTALMNDAATSHPYYWSGFAIIGDGARPLVRANESRAEAPADMAGPQRSGD